MPALGGGSTLPSARCRRCRALAANMRIVGQSMVLNRSRRLSSHRAIPGSPRQTKRCMASFTSSSPRTTSHGRGLAADRFRRKVAAKKAMRPMWTCRASFETPASSTKRSFKELHIDCRLSAALALTSSRARFSSVCSSRRVVHFSPFEPFPASPIALRSLSRTALRG
jgi:hypothetical protein